MEQGKERISSERGLSGEHELDTQIVLGVLCRSAERRISERLASEIEVAPQERLALAQSEHSAIFAHQQVPAAAERTTATFVWLLGVVGLKLVVESTMQPVP